MARRAEPNRLSRFLLVLRKMAKSVIGRELFSKGTGRQRKPLRIEDLYSSVSNDSMANQMQEIVCKSGTTDQVYAKAQGFGGLRVPQKQQGFSLIELLIVVAIILVIAAIAIPNLIRSRIASNNAAAAATVRTINTAEAAYTTFYPGQGFATLSVLGPGATPCSTTGGGPTNACLLDSSLGCTATECQKDAFWYNVTLSGGLGYTVSATPTGATNGDKDFCSNEDSVIHAQADSSPTPGGSVLTHTACEALPPQ